MHGRQQNEKELCMINIVHHPFRGEETLRLTNNCLSPNLPLCRGDDDDDVVVTDAPPLPPESEQEGPPSQVVRRTKEHFKVPNFDIRNGTRKMGSSGWRKSRADDGKRRHAPRAIGREESPGHGAEASIISAK